MKSLRKYFKETPDTKTAMIWFFAMHGGSLEAQQCVLIDEYDPKTKFYRIWQVEALIRDLSKKHSNSFHLTIFACCREYLDKK